MAIFSDHPYTSITVKIDQLAKPDQNHEVDNSLELYVSDLLHLIKLQPGSGASEAARAIRKRIKYGDSVEEQIRALNILELLILNSGSKIGPVIARDDKLLDVLKGIISGSGKTALSLLYDSKVQTRARALAIGWKSELRDLEGYKYMASLWKFIPGSKHHRRTGSRPATTDETNAFEDADIIRSPSPTSPAVRRSIPPPRPSSPSPYSSPKVGKKFSSKKDKTKKKKKKRGGVVYADERYQIPQINYSVEAPKIRSTIADCHSHVTGLNNALISLPTGVSPLDDSSVQKEFASCKEVRRKVLKYLQYVGAGDPEEKRQDVLKMDEEFLGILIDANENLVAVFKKYDSKCGYTADNPAPALDDDDSGESYYTSEESEYDDELDSVTEGVSNIPIKPAPPVPQKPQIQRTTTNATVTSAATASSDPFGDGNEVSHTKSVYY